MSLFRQGALQGLLATLCAAALAGPALAACTANPSAPSGLCGHPGAVDGATVRRDNSLPENHEHFTFAATVEVSEPGKARAIAAAVCGLPLMPAKPIVCGADAGITYRLTFTADGRKPAAVTIRASGCENVQGLGRARWALRSAGFWHTLGVAMDLTHPYYAAFSGSIA
jgi:hypothetical protein